MDSVYVDALADAIWTHTAKKFDYRLYNKADGIRLQEEGSGAPGNRTPLVKSLVVSDSLLIFLSF